MRIKNISACNYRTLENIKIHFKNNYCTISGKNNAGKSCVIRLLSSLFRTSQLMPWTPEDSGFVYSEDRTQWAKDNPSIEVLYCLEINNEEDPALISFIEKIADQHIESSSALLNVSYKLTDNDITAISVSLNNIILDTKAAKEIDEKIKNSNLLFLYNSTRDQHDFYYGRGRMRMFYDFVMSPDEKKALDKASRQMETLFRRQAKEHTQALSRILGRLSEKYDVEVSPPESFAARRMPLSINLRDRNVKVPLDDWGSGTQNRTHILMAILQANRIKTTGSSDEKITPLVVIEEPESFLHPTAQAEFGRMLRHLSGEFGIQIIATTHSPYMLNQEDPTSNILLTRKMRGKKAYETVLVDTDGENWMAPFCDHLGIGPKDFSALRPLFSADRSKVLLVEGTIDQEYLKFFQTHGLTCELLADDVEVVPYGGKDTLKNTLLLKFVIGNFDRVFVTFDLDAKNDVRSALDRIGLKEGKNYSALGLSVAGKNCIEGLLPTRVLSVVNGKETDLVMKLTSNDTKERRSAKDSLKRKYLEEFIKNDDYSRDELVEFGKAIKIINKGLGL
jgi:ABC-type Mn2+/Zn2+ transport system ATPase subunit